MNNHLLSAQTRCSHEAKQVETVSVTFWGTGLPLRELLHVDDLGEACVFALECWQSEAGEPPHLNVGTGADCAIRKRADAVAEATGSPGENIWDNSKHHGTPKKQLNVIPLAALGWRARIPLAEGLANTVVYNSFHCTMRN